MIIHSLKLITANISVNMYKYIYTIQYLAERSINGGDYTIPLFDNEICYVLWASLERIIWGQISITKRLRHNFQELR